MFHKNILEHKFIVLVYIREATETNASGVSGKPVVC